jgi:hypothetical protein
MFNFGGGCCWRYRQHLAGGSPLMSPSTSVVAAAGDTSNTSQGAHHRRLFQLRWWLWPEIPVAPPRGLPSMFASTSVVATAGDTVSTSQGAFHRRLLQLQWWLRPGILTAPPRGPVIYVCFNINGGCYRRYRHHLLGGPSLTSASTSMAAAAGDTGRTSQGAHH